MRISKWERWTKILFLKPRGTRQAAARTRMQTRMAKRQIEQWWGEGEAKVCPRFKAYRGSKEQHKVTLSTIWKACSKTKTWALGRKSKRIFDYHNFYSSVHSWVVKKMMRCCQIFTPVFVRTHKNLWAVLWVFADDCWSDVVRCRYSSRAESPCFSSFLFWVREHPAFEFESCLFWLLLDKLVVHVCAESLEIGFRLVKQSFWNIWALWAQHYHAHAFWRIGFC